MDKETCIYIDSNVSFSPILCIEPLTPYKVPTDDLQKWVKSVWRTPRRRAGFADGDWTALGHLYNPLVMFLPLS